MRSILVVIFLVFISSLSAQVKNTGFPHYDDVPSSPPPFLPFSSEVRYDISRQQLFVWDRDLLLWKPMAGGTVESVTGNSPVSVNNTDPANPIVGVDTTMAGTGLATRGYSDAGDNTLAQVIADSSHWQRSGDSLVYATTSYTAMANSRLAGLKIQQTPTVGQNETHALLDLISIGYAGSNQGRNLYAIQTTMSDATANNRYGGIKMNFNFTGTSNRSLGYLDVAITEQGGGSSAVMNRNVHTYTSWPSSGRNYEGEFSEHIFPSSSTTAGAHLFYGKVIKMTSTGSPNSTQGISTKFSGLVVDMNLSNLPETQQLVRGVHIINRNAHPEEYGLFQQTVGIKNYLAGRLGILNQFPTYTLDIGGTNAVKFPVGTTAQRPTGILGALRGNSSHGGFDLHDGIAWRRAAYYTDVTPADGNTLVYSTAEGAFVPKDLSIKLFTPTSSADATGNIGDITYDDDYIFVKTSTGWKRSTLTSF